MTYEDLERAVIEWAPTQPGILAVVAIGSRARREHAADEWSDLDLMLLATDSTRYANDEWLSDLGVAWLAFIEEANAGDPDVQAIFEGGVKGDFTFVTVPDAGYSLSELLDGIPYQGVLSRGGRVLFDRTDPAGHARTPRTLPERGTGMTVPPTEEEFRQLLSGFWLYASRVAKFARRRDLWRATLNLIFQLDLRLLKLMEWHAVATGSRDVWYDGRFMEEWADPRALQALPGVFPHYDASEVHSALLAAVELVRLLAQETADRLGYAYPSDLDRRISGIIW